MYKDIEKQITFLNTIFDEFNKEKIDYCVLRNYEKIPYDIGNDIDFAINPNDIKKIFKLLSKISLKFNFKLIKKTNRLGHLGLYYQDINSDNLIVLDFLSKSIKQWLEYADTNFILKARISYKNFYVAPLGAIYYTIFFKDLLTYNKLRSKNQDLFVKISENDKDDFIKTGKMYFDDFFLEDIFYQLVNKRILVSRDIVYLKLIKSMNLRNFISFFYYRGLDTITYNLYWKWIK